MPATWGKNTLTNQALTMMNQALGISAITFTKAVTITDDITGDSVSQLQALTSVNYKQSRTPKAIATQDNKSRLGVTIDNSDVNEDYTYYGVGLYAKQNSTNQEVLFSIIPLTAGATMIAKENNATTASIYLDLYTDIVRGTQVTIMVSNSGTLSREDVQQMISQSIGNALNYPNETASIGTDLDTILDISITRIINDTTVVHAPSDFSGTGYLITIGSGDKTVPIVHTLDDTINNIRSTRYFNSTTNVWSEWNAYAKTVDVNQQLDKKVNVSDMRKPASDVAGIEEVNAKQDLIGYTPADDSKVAHLSGANDFDTVPTVNNNPLLLASSLPSDLARTDSDQEFTGKNTFDTAPIDKATGNPYITKDGVPSIPSDVARTGQAQTFTAAQTFSIAPTIKDASKDKGDNQAATMADLKSVENSAWRVLDQSNAPSNISFRGQVLYKIDDANKIIYFTTNGPLDGDDYRSNLILIDFKGIVNNLLSGHGRLASVSDKIQINDSDISATSTYVKNSQTLFSGNLISYGDPGVKGTRKM